MAIDAVRASSPQLPTADPVETALQALAERADAFTEASEALRAEILAFQAAVAEAEGRPAEPALKLVVSRETAEMEAIGEAETAGESGGTGDDVQVAAMDDYRPTPAQIAEFFRTHGEPEKPEPEPVRQEPSAPAVARERNLDRERLYADIGGAIIGLGAAAALINFVLL
jgi:hypothetical protein